MRGLPVRSAINDIGRTHYFLGISGLDMEELAIATVAAIADMEDKIYSQDTLAAFRKLFAVFVGRYSLGSMFDLFMA